MRVEKKRIRIEKLSECVVEECVVEVESHGLNEYRKPLGLNGVKTLVFKKCTMISDL